MGTQNQAAISQRIAKFALSSRLSEIPDAVVEYGKLLLMDTFGVAMSCQDMDHVKAIRGALAEMGSTPRCTLWGTEEKVRLADAVLYNSALIHGADYDDTHVGGIVHPSAAVVSTALTVGEECRATGRQMMEAIVAGWEIIIRLALAAKGRFHDVGFHGTGIVAPFAAACTAARLLGDSEETLVNAGPPTAPSTPWAWPGTDSPAPGRCLRGSSVSGTPTAAARTAWRRFLPAPTWERSGAPRRSPSSCIPSAT